MPTFDNSKSSGVVLFNIRKACTPTCLPQWGTWTPSTCVVANMGKRHLRKENRPETLCQTIPCNFVEKEHLTPSWHGPH